jgi:SH3-like domain-containing protein
MRLGPNINQDTIIVYKCLHYPMKILDKSEDWYKVEDINHNIGWINNPLLSHTKYAHIYQGIIDLETKKESNDVFLYRLPDDKSQKLARIQIGTNVEILNCNDFGCKISINKIKGWIKNEHLWGISSVN